MAGEELGVSGLLPLPDGGDFVLGQVASDGAVQAESIAGGFALEKAFAGNLSHFNIWDYVMSEDDIKLAFDDCTYTHCGNAVEWISFRSGTRGTARLRWPSGVPGSKCAANSCKIRLTRLTADMLVAGTVLLWFQCYF